MWEGLDITSYSTLQIVDGAHGPPKTSVWIVDCRAHRTIRRQAVEKSEGEGKSCCLQMNLTEVDWKVGAEAILDECQRMVMSEQRSCPKNWQTSLHQKGLPALTTGSPSTSSASASGPQTSPGTRQRRCARLSTETWPAFSARTRMHLY